MASGRVAGNKRSAEDHRRRSHPHRLGAHLGERAAHVVEGMFEPNPSGQQLSGTGPISSSQFCIQPIVLARTALYHGIPEQSKAPGSTAEPTSPVAPGAGAGIMAGA
jgi:hypothetical protein